MAYYSSAYYSVSIIILFLRIIINIVTLVVVMTLARLHT